MSELYIQLAGLMGVFFAKNLVELGVPYLQRLKS